MSERDELGRPRGRLHPHRVPGDARRNLRRGSRERPSSLRARRARRSPHERRDGDRAGVTPEARRHGERVDRRAARRLQNGVPLTCQVMQPNGKGIVETGAASSPSFSSTTAGPFVQQNSSVFATAGQANTWWRRAVTPSLLTCAAQTIDALAAKGVKVVAHLEGHAPRHDVAAAHRRVSAWWRWRTARALLRRDRSRLRTNDHGHLGQLLPPPVPAKYERALATRRRP